MYQSGDEVVDTSQRVDHYWASVFQEKTSQGQFRCSILPKLVKSVLSLVRGNADVERSLSANERTVFADRASLSDVTINGLRTVKDQVKARGRPHEVPTHRVCCLHLERRTGQMQSESLMKKKLNVYRN